MKRMLILCSPGVSRRVSEARIADNEENADRLAETDHSGQADPERRKNQKCSKHGGISEC